MILKNYTKEIITNLINIIKKCVMDDRVTVSLEGSRVENMQFIEEYNINEEKIVDMLTGLTEADFCYGLKNMQNGNVCNDLYVFCPVRELYNIKGEKESVDVYMRFNIIETGGGKYRALVSLHKRNKPITYLFS
ncbi:hypothetical protein [uncultured Clostridium sp.]|uniref:hypothetical protein n=1 Tax=uncultured Clostridium sp. TaxID=59620 RepID=UPI0025E4F14A|nr:hypothetical protein [uncultured Clostridium sp.]